jgi:hypothetical protein
LNNCMDTGKAAVPIWGICAMWLVYESELSAISQSKATD